MPSNQTTTSFPARRGGAAFGAVRISTLRAPRPYGVDGTADPGAALTRRTVTQFISSLPSMVLEPSPSQTRGDFQDAATRMMANVVAERRSIFGSLNLASLRSPNAQVAAFAVTKTTAKTQSTRMGYARGPKLSPGMK